MTNPFQKDATRISAMTPTEDAPINCFSLGNEISYHIKKEPFPATRQKSSLFSHQLLVAGLEPARD